MNAEETECKACLALQLKAKLDIISVPNKEVATIPNKEVATIPNKEVATIPNKDVATIPNKELAKIPNKEVATIPNKELAKIPNKEVATIPNKEVATVPNKELAKIPNKEVAKIPNKEVIALPNDSCKQVANIPINKALVGIPKMDVCISGYRLPRACFTCNLNKLPKDLKLYVESQAKICEPESIHICDGSEEENLALLKILEESGRIQKLDNMTNCWLTCTDPKDVARVEARTFISTSKQIDAIPLPKHGFSMPDPSINLPNLRCSELGNWMSLEDAKKEVNRRLKGCMRGRTMYIIPYLMGPFDGKLSKFGIEITDSPYVVCSMRIMTRIGKEILDKIHNDTPFVKCLHSVGVPLPTTRKLINNWPCNPEMTMICHFPENGEVVSYGSGYGGNSLLGKKCFALRLGSFIAKKEGWLAEHMLIMGLTNPQGKKKYIAAAFPSQCGKTNMAMLKPSIPGWKVECVGDDIAWMKFDENGVLRAVNPESGFFGVCPGTSEYTNPNALKTIQYNTIFTNVAHTEDGRVYWEGLDDSMVSHDEHLISWKGEDWTKNKTETAAHPNARFCAPVSQCPIIDPNWENPEGVPISAIIFGGRRPNGIPLVSESFDWNHGVFLGASLKSETTAAAEHKKKNVVHDPFSMRPFFGYNFGDYMQHWFSLNKNKRQMPKIFMVNWFRKDHDGKGDYLWPGFGENIRVLEWIFNRCDNMQDIAETTPLGYIPKLSNFNVKGLNLDKEQLRELFKIDKKFLEEEVKEMKNYLNEYVTDSTPPALLQQLEFLTERIKTVADWEFV